MQGTRQFPGSLIRQHWQLKSAQNPRFKTFVEVIPKIENESLEV
jgi:hypothetical protein